MSRFDAWRSASRGIERPGFAEYVITEVFRQVLRCTEVDVPADDRAQSQNHLPEAVVMPMMCVLYTKLTRPHPIWTFGRLPMLAPSFFFCLMPRA